MARSLLFILALLFQVNYLPAQTVEQSYFEWTELPFVKEELAQRRFLLIQNLKNAGATGIAIIPSQDGFTSGETFRQRDDFYYFTGLELPNSLLVVDIDEKVSVVYVPESDLRFYSPARPNDFPGRPLLNDPAISSLSGIVLKNSNNFSRYMNKAAKASSTIWLNAGKIGQISLPTQDYITTPSPEQWLVQVLQLRHSRPLPD